MPVCDHVINSGVLRHLGDLLAVLLDLVVSGDVGVEQRGKK